MIPVTTPGYSEHSTNGVRHFGFIPQRALQTAELNGMQKMLDGRHERAFATLYADGAVISGIQPRMVDTSIDYNLLVAEGKVFLKGDVLDVPEGRMQIPDSTHVTVGLRYRESLVTALEDPSIKDPSIETANYQNEGAMRVMFEYDWGWLDETGASDVNSTWEFYGIFEVVNGVILVKPSTGVSDKTQELVASYDRNSHGNYIVRGFDTKFVQTLMDGYAITVESGLANIFGYQVERQTGSRMVLPMDFDVSAHAFEPHTFSPDGSGNSRIYTNLKPIAAISQVVGYKRKVETVTHSLTVGGTDVLAESSVGSIISVVQGGTTYTSGVDFLVVGNQLQWSPVGPEPTTGGSYTVTYTYLTTVVPTTVADDYFIVNGLESGTIMQVNYTRKTPRRDLIVLTKDNELLQIKGIPHARNPAPPSAAIDQIALAEVYHTWTGNPVVTTVAITSVPYSTLSEMRSALVSLGADIASLNLKQAITAADPASKRGIFTDPLRNDLLRDQGTAQTAAIVNGTLKLPLEDVVYTLTETANSDNQLLPYTLVTEIQQLAVTAGTRLNPRNSFQPVPARVTLKPKSDKWQRAITGWKSDVTSFFSNEGEEVLIETMVRDRSYRMRMINVQVTVNGFAPNEAVNEMTFHGIPLTF